MIREETPLSPETRRVLVLDRDPHSRRALAACLQGLGCATEQAASAPEALRILRSQPVDLAFCALGPGLESGLNLLPRLLSEQPGLYVAVMAAEATAAQAVEAMRRGAQDYLAKPLERELVRREVGRARAHRAAERGPWSGEAGQEEEAVQLKTASPRMKAALRILERAAVHDVPVLLRVSAAPDARRSRAGCTPRVKGATSPSPRRTAPLTPRSTPGPRAAPLLAPRETRPGLPEAPCPAPCTSTTWRTSHRRCKSDSCS